MSVNSKICATWLIAIVIFGFAPAIAKCQSSANNAPPQQSGKSSEVHTPKPGGPPLQVLVPNEPWAFRSDGKWHLVYELQVTNLGKWDCLLTRLDAVTGDSGVKPTASYSGTELAGMIDRTGQTVSEKAKIEPGAFAIIYVWLNFERSEDAPAKVGHRITMKVRDYPEAITLDGIAVSTDRKPMVIISSPLAGENWINNVIMEIGEGLYAFYAHMQPRLASCESRR